MKNDLQNDTKGSCGCGGGHHKEQATPKTRGAQEDYPAKVTPDAKPTRSFTTDKKASGDR